MAKEENSTSDLVKKETMFIVAFVCIIAGFLLGIMYRRSGQPQKAIEAFDRAIATDPKHENSRFNKGIVLMHDLNDREGAIAAWEELVEVNPNALTPNGSQPLKVMIDRVKGSMN